MAIKNKAARKKDLLDKIDNIQFLSLINEIIRFTIFRGEEEIKDIIQIDVTEKTISVTHPDYEIFSYKQKKAVNLLITKYKFYIQWKFFQI